MANIRNLINLFLKTIKWPIAILMISLLQPTLKAFTYYIKHFGFNHQHMLYFAIGFCCYFGMKIFMMAGNYYRTDLEIINHELTHALFAILTLHPAGKLEANEKTGGSITITGGGNWLITIAPYFFPTFACGLMIFVHIYTQHNPITIPLLVGLGFALGYHVMTVIQETHPNQSDLHRVGFPFAFLFIPTANLLFIGGILAFADRGGQGIGLFLKSVFYIAKYYLDKIF